MLPSNIDYLITTIHIKGLFLKNYLKNYLKSHMKYAHLADLHLGAWREPKMRDLSTNTFLAAIDSCIAQKVDFILFSGDIFNTSLPAIETLKIVTKRLKELKDSGIPLYVIAGSHDFSSSGKTMIDVLENAGLLQNVCKGHIDPETHQLHLHFTKDEKTGAKITGILGRKGQLDRTYYENLFLDNLEREEGYKIFMFHTSISELKPPHLPDLESQPASFLPRGFNYYAGGHIHHPTQITLPNYGLLTYPGALFPNSFAEIEKYSHGGYYLLSSQETREETPEEKSTGSENKSKPPRCQWIPLQTAPHHKLVIDCSHKSPDIIAFEIIDHFSGKDITNAIITIRLSGTLDKAKPSDIDFKVILERLYAQGASIVLKNSSQLSSAEFEEIKMNVHSAETMEEEIIKEHLTQSPLFTKEQELHLIKSLLMGLNTSKKEGETLHDFQNRIEEEVGSLCGFERERTNTPNSKIISESLLE